MLLNFLTGSVYIKAIDYLGYAVTLGFITAVIIYANGGLLQTWIAITPLIFVGISSQPSGPIATGFPLGVAVVLVFGAGTVAYTSLKLVLIPFAGYLLALESATTSESHEPIDGEYFGSHTESGKDGRTDRLPQRTIPVTRRWVVYLLGGGTLIAAMFGYVYGWWCKTSPADVFFENKSESPVDLEMTISRYGYEVFQKTITLGVVDSRNVVETVDSVNLSRKEFERAIPIGCGLPKDIYVEIEADNGLAIADTVRFPEPDPQTTHYSPSSKLRITVLDNEIELEAEIVSPVA